MPAHDRHVLEGLKLEELEALNSSGYLPDKFNAWKSCAAAGQRKGKLGIGPDVTCVTEAFAYVYVYTMCRLSAARHVCEGLCVCIYIYLLMHIYLI